MAAPESPTSQDAALSNLLSAAIGSPETSVPVLSAEVTQQGHDTPEDWSNPPSKKWRGVMVLKLEESYALDDSCQLKYWARGHWSWGEFVTAVQDRIRDDERDIPNWVVIQAPVKTLYQRAVPCRNSPIADTQLVHSETPGRGATPVTVMEFWFPMHAYLPAKPKRHQIAGEGI